MARPTPGLSEGTTDDDDDMPNWSAETMQAVIDFINRPYWYRVWTFQELVLAKAIYIICGNRCVPWSMLLHIDRFAGAWYALDYDTKKDNMPALLVANNIAQVLIEIDMIFPDFIGGILENIFRKANFTRDFKGKRTSRFSDIELE